MKLNKRISVLTVIFSLQFTSAVLAAPGGDPNQKPTVPSIADRLETDPLAEWEQELSPTPTATPAPTVAEVRSTPTSVGATGPQGVKGEQGEAAVTPVATPAQTPAVQTAVGPTGPQGDKGAPATTPGETVNNATPEVPAEEKPAVPAAKTTSNTGEATTPGAQTRKDARAAAAAKRAEKKATRPASQAGQSEKVRPKGKTETTRTGVKPARAQTKKENPFFGGSGSGKKSFGNGGEEGEEKGRGKKRKR